MLLFLPRNLAAVAKVAARDGSRFAMQTVRVADPGDGTFRVEATDGKMLMIARGPCEADPEFPLPDGFTPVGLGEALLGAGDWQELLRIESGESGRGPRGLAPVPVVLARDTEGKTLGVKFMGQRWLTPAEGRFPDTDQVMPKGRGLVWFKVGAKALVDLLQAARSVAGADAQVEVHWYGNGNPIGLACEGPGGLVVDMLLMPLT
jgi:hypothetical protein